MITTEPHAARYSAFISYSHRDTAFARRLHRALESYRLPRRLAEGPSIERRLRPIFRDREELRAAPDLTEAVRAAIADSSHLIVVCSPDAAASIWVGREVALFRELHGHAPILAALCRGDASSAFHPELRRAKDGIASLTPLAADFRRGGDGAHLALLKLVAALAEVRLEALVQRDAQRRNQQVTAVCVGAMAGMLAMGVLATEAIRGRAAAEAERGRSEMVIDFMLSDLRRKLEGVGRLDLLDIVNRGALNYYRGQDLAHLSVAERQQRARLLIDIGQDDERRGDYQASSAQFEEARRTTRSLLNERPQDPQRIFDHAQSEYWNGLIRWRLRDVPGAEAGFRRYASLAHQLVKISPDRSEWRMELGYAESDLGMFLLDEAMDTNRAQAYFDKALGDFEAVQRRHPDDQDVKLQIADGWAWLGAVARTRGAFAEANTDWMIQRRMLFEIIAHDPRNAEVRTDLASNELGLGRIAAAEGDFDRALAWLRLGNETVRTLALNDPEDSYIAREGRAIALFTARTWLTQPPQRRPLARQIAAKIGQCPDDRAAGPNGELTAFCMILLARLTDARGDRAAALGILASPTVRSAEQGPTLSENWSINFRDEIRAVLSRTRSDNSQTLSSGDRHD